MYVPETPFNVTVPKPDTTMVSSAFVYVPSLQMIYINSKGGTMMKLAQKQ